MAGDDFEALTYPRELVGASLRDVATGQDGSVREFHTVDRSWLLGLGDAVFDAATQTLLRWDMHRAAGLSIPASTAAPAPGAVVESTIGWGPVKQRVPCLVVAVVDQPDAQGFAYGTLPGHPESGEESFVVERRAGGAPAGEAAEVWFHVRAFSRPASRLSRWSGPLGRVAQHVVTDRYAAALMSVATDAVTT